MFAGRLRHRLPLLLAALVAAGALASNPAHATATSPPPALVVGKAPKLAPAELRHRRPSRKSGHTRTRARLAAWVAGNLVNADSFCTLGTMQLVEPIIRPISGSEQLVAFRADLYRTDGGNIPATLYSSTDWFYATALNWGAFRSYGGYYFTNARTGQRYSEWRDVPYVFPLTRTGLYRMAIRVAWYSSTGALVQQSNDWLTIREQENSWCIRS
jgi:hypothetical protein